MFIFILIAFAYTKLETLIGRDDVDIIETFQDNYWKDSEQFTASENDFFMAAALTHYDSNPEPVEKKEYGELLMEHYGWGNSALGYEYGSHPLDNHPCSDEELGYKRSPNTVIYPVFHKAQAEVNTYKKKFKCVDNEHLRIWGDYNSAMAMQLSIKFHMCSGHEYCKTE